MDKEVFQSFAKNVVELVDGDTGLSDLVRKMKPFDEHAKEKGDGHDQPPPFPGDQSSA